MNKYKVYIIGGTDYYREYVNWCEADIVENIEECDFVMGCGGADVDPSTYGHKRHSTTYPSIERDHYEIDMIDLAVSLNKPIWGTCRFAQLLCAIQPGGFLVQDMRHTYLHPIITNEGKELVASSAHHQLQCVNDIDPSLFILLAWADNISKFHSDDTGEIELKDNKEPEIVFYKNQYAIGAQMHPEYLWRDGEHDETIEYCQDLLKKLINREF